MVQAPKRVPFFSRVTEQLRFPTFQETERGLEDEIFERLQRLEKAFPLRGCGEGGGGVSDLGWGEGEGFRFRELLLVFVFFSGGGGTD